MGSTSSSIASNSLVCKRLGLEKLIVAPSYLSLKKKNEKSEKTNKKKKKSTALRKKNLLIIV